MKLKLSILALVICTLVSAQGKKKAPRSSKKGRGNLPTNFWVKKTSKSRKLYAQSIKCDVGGTLTLNMGKTMGKTITSKVTAGRYVRVGTPKTAAIKAIDTAMNSGKWAAVISKSTAYLSKNAWLGWGGYVGYMKGKAQLAKKDIVGAERTFKAAEKYAKVGKPAYYAKIKRGSIEALLANGKYNQADKKLRGVRRSAANLPFIYVTTGKVLEGNKRNKEALFEYLKVVSVYKNNEDAKLEVRDALKSIVKILKELGDQRHKDFAKELEAMSSDT